MPMLLVSDAEFELEMNRIVEYKEIKHGRGNVKEVPSSVREMIAERAIEGEKVVDIASEYGISASSISAYKNGATSTTTYHNPDEKLTKANNQVRERILEKANGRLSVALEKLTDEKLEVVKARDLASIAKDMSAITKNLTPDNGFTINDNHKVLIYKPRMKEEDDYDVIEVNE